ncbi:MAG: (Fe-S)-binding protein [Nitrososphaeria archaeon]
MHFMQELQAKMPFEDCGLCGQISCRQAAIAIARGELDPQECPILSNEKKDILNEIYKLIDEGVGDDNIEEGVGISSITPCSSDSSKVMIVYYPRRVGEIKINPFHEKLLKTLFDKATTLYSKFSPELGVSRIEKENGEYILFFVKGKIVVRQAISEESGKKFLQEVLNVAWLAKNSCRQGYTILEGLYNLCNCNQTLESIKEGPDNICYVTKNFREEKDVSEFFERFNRAIFENLTTSTVNKYLHICGFNFKEHLKNLQNSEEREEAIYWAKLTAKWLAINEALSTFTTKYSFKEQVKILTTVFKSILSNEIEYLDNLKETAKDYCWPKNFVISKMVSHAKRYFSVKV